MPADAIVIDTTALSIDQVVEQCLAWIEGRIEKITEKREVDFAKSIGDFNLSKREAEVLKLVCYGHTNREIAGKLFISEYTVKDHIKKIMEKMEVQSRSEIIALLK